MTVEGSLLQRLLEILQALIDGGLDLGPSVGGGGLQFVKLRLQFVGFLLRLADLLVEVGLGLAGLLLGFGLQLVEFLAEVAESGIGFLVERLDLLLGVALRR